MNGRLYIVATPIGNLTDFSYRAVAILKQVDLIAAEDTRHVKILLQHYGISNPLISLHQHNESKVSPTLVDKIKNGLNVALVCDAGTPLLSDPGLLLVKLARQHGLEVSPIPGACALIAALSVSGLPITQFRYEGFSPRMSVARKIFFTHRKNETSTWVFYESCHRILSSLTDLAHIISTDRTIVLARELTKLHETIIKDSLGNILERVKNDNCMRKGEFVVVVAGADIQKSVINEQQMQVLNILLKECSLKIAVSLAAKITGSRKKLLYQAALEITSTDTDLQH